MATGRNVTFLVILTLSVFGLSHFSQDAEAQQFIYVSNTMTWQQAENFAMANHGGHLASIDSQAVSVSPANGRGASARDSRW